MAEQPPRLTPGGVLLSRNSGGVMPLLLRQQRKLSRRLMSTALDVCGVRLYRRPRARGNQPRLRGIYMPAPTVSHLM
jgi:hypothetical protein